ncbi:MAG: hypothetical protein COV66_11005 [Nitrospinae bacterium CG11_big_fil_rev_8_21_14_0_20_45_15]|nr:MAG: hypothetical protein COV66_11005 [Nitrospinae bacterium CG11_big_fil_rev_8_21_14_0_20_45_15]
MNLKIIDFLISVLSAALIAFATSQILVGSGGSPLLMMIAGGLLGMALSIPLMIVLVPPFGAFEVMIALHWIGMPAGMIGAMMIGYAPNYCIAVSGAAWGLFVWGLIEYFNRRYEAGRYESEVL